jgi:hypothetical protein
MEKTRYMLNGVGLGQELWVEAVGIACCLVNGSPSSALDQKCIFIGYKDGLKGYKIWNLETKKVVYSRDVIFRETKDVVKHDVLRSKEEPEKIEFDLKDDESESTEEHESEEEGPHTPILRRSV